MADCSLQGLSETRVEACVIGFIKNEKPLAHKVVGRGSFVEIKGETNLLEAEKTLDHDAGNGAAKLEAIAAHALSDDDPLVEVPTLYIRGKRDENTAIFTHTLQTFEAAEKIPHGFGLESKLVFAGSEVVEGHGHDAMRGYGMELGEELVPGAAGETNGREVGAQERVS